MDKQFGTTQKDRRTFLKKLAIFGGSATLLAIGAGVDPDSRGKMEQPTEERKRSKGYRVTPHIKKYYAKADF